MAFRIDKQVFKTNFLLKQYQSLVQDSGADYTVIFTVIIVKLPQNMILQHFVKQQMTSVASAISSLSDGHVSAFHSLKYCKMILS